MDPFFRYCCYVLAIFTIGIGIHYVLNYMYPPMCENCKKSGGAKTMWEHLEIQKQQQKRKQVNEQEDNDDGSGIDEDI